MWHETTLVSVASLFTIQHQYTGSAKLRCELDPLAPRPASLFTFQPELEGFARLEEHFDKDDKHSIVSRIH